MKNIFKLSNGILVLFCLVTVSAQAKLTVASYNIRTFDSKKSPTDKVELRKILSDLDADFITVEEIVNASSFESFAKKYLPGYGLYLSKCGGGGRQKIGFLYRKNIFRLNQVHEDSRLSEPGNIVGQYGCGRLRPALIGLFTHLKTNEELVAIGIHLKAGSSASNYEKRAKQYKIVAKIVDELRLADHKNIVLMGDFNSTGFLSQDEDFLNFDHMLAEMQMNTSSRELECTAYWSGEDRTDRIEIPSILDHVIYPSNLLGKKIKKVSVFSHCAKTACKISSQTELGRSYQAVSDHCPVSITLE